MIHFAMIYSGLAHFLKDVKVHFINQICLLGKLCLCFGGNLICDENKYSKTINSVIPIYIN